MRTKKLLVNASAALLMGAIAVVSGAVLNMSGSIADQECLKNGCAGTLTQFTGAVITNVDPNDDLPTMVGRVIGSVTGSFNVSTWGDFSIATKTGTAAAPTYGPASVVTLQSGSAAVPYPCAQGSYVAVFGTQAVLYSDLWGDMGFSLSGSYFCFQSPDRALILNIASPELGNLTAFTGFSSSQPITDVNGPTIGLAFNGLGVLSKNANNVEGLRNRLQTNYGDDPFAYGSQSLATLSTTLTKYDFNIDVRRNVQDQTEYLVPWDKTNLPTPMGAWGAGFASAGKMRLSDDVQSLLFFNADVNSTPNAATKNQVVWFNFQGQSCPAVNGNAGCAVQIDGEIPQGIVNPADLAGLNKTEVNGQKTVIIEGGNLYISSDMYYENTGSLAVFVVRRDREDPSKGGNVYVDPRVTNVVGSFVIDGAFMNFDGTNVLAQEGANAATLLKLRRQLLVYGSVASSNSIGGSAKGTLLCDAGGTACKCPYGTDWEKQNGSTTCTAAEASKYDMAALRTFQTRQSILDPWQTDGAGPLGAFACETGNGDALPETQVPAATSSPSYDEVQYAWAGKKKCYASDVPTIHPTLPGVTTERTNPMIIDFNKTIVTSDMGILRKSELSN